MALAELRFTSGPMAGQSLSLPSSLMIGRAEPAPGDLGGEPRLSREHARISQTQGGGYGIEDLGSKNGTFVNGQRLSGWRPLVDGDRIRMGATDLEFVADPAARIGALSAVPVPPPLHSPTPPGGPPPYPQPGYPVPGPPGQPPRRGAPGWVPVLVGIAIIALLAGAGGYLLRGGTGTPTASGIPSSSPGEVVAEAPSDCGTSLGGGQTVGYVAYVESNRATPNGNSVILMPYAPDLTPLPPAQCATGGSGSADLTDSGVLDADNQVLLSPDHRLLFAVNQGSDTIAVFHVDPRGALAAVSGSPFPSGGMAPASIGLAGDVLVVANKAQDGIRDLSTVAPTYTTLRVAADGTLSQIANSTISADPGSSPTDAYVPPGSRVVFSTEESGPLRGFSVDPNGVLVQASNSPLAPDAAIFASGFNPAKEFGLGIAAHPSAKFLYIGMPTVPALAVYSYDDSGLLTFVKSVPDAGGYLPCWVVTTTDGKWAYVANAATDNITVYAISDAVNPRQIQTFAFEQPGNPWNETIDPTGKYLFVNTPRDTLGVPEGEGNTQHVMAIGSDGLLTEVAGSPVKIPVASGVNPQGVAVLAIGN